MRNINFQIIQKKGELSGLITNKLYKLQNFLKRETNINYMNIRRTIAKVTPPAIKSIFYGSIKKKEVKKLKALNKLSCDTSNLKSKKEIVLSKALKSDEISSSWEQNKSKIGKFEIPDLTGGVNVGDRRAIFHLIRYFKPKSVLEVGTHIGASTVNIALALHLNQVEEKTDSSLTTVDIIDVNSETKKHWANYGMKISPLEMIKNLKFDNFVKFKVDTSFHFLETSKESYDFIFLDGDHFATTVYQEIPLALKKLNKGGVILLHDYFPNNKPMWSNNSVISGPYLATERLISEGANITILPLGDLPWPTKLGSNMTSLALLVKND